MFLGLKPVIGVVTNLEHDHPDIYPTPESFKEAFVDFVHLLPPNGAFVYCGDDAGASNFAKEAKVETISYGVEKVESGKWVRAENIEPNKKGGYNFTCRLPLATCDLSLQVPGKHNVLNALAVMAVIHRLGLPLQEAAEALNRFTGTGRRFELVGSVQGIHIYDDYAHHPTEIRATLAGARARYPESRIWAVWQPHTYSRTLLLFDEFANAFNDADQVIVTEVYRSREAKQDFSSAEVVAAMAHPAANFIAELQDVSTHLLANLRAGDVVITLSAGDAVEITQALLAGLKQKEA